MGPRGLALLALAAGCTRSLGLELPAPASLGAPRALVLVLAEGDRPLAAFGHDVAEGAVPPSLASVQGDLTLYLLSYPQPLARLGYRPGQLALGGPQRLARPWSTLHTTRIVSDRPDGWQRLADTPPWLDGLNVEVNGSPCIQPGSGQDLVLPDNASRYGFLLRTSDDRLIVGVASGLFEVPLGPQGIEGAAAPLDFAATSTAPPLAGIVGEDRIWILDGRGDLWRGPPDGPRALAGRSPAPMGERAWMDGLDADGRVDLFYTTGQGALVHFDGARFTELSTGAEHLGAGGGVARVGDRAAYAIIRKRALLFAGPGRVERSALAGGLRLTTLRFIPELGLFAGAGEAGGLWRLTGSRWDQLQAEILDSLLIAPFEDHVVYGGQLGIVSFALSPAYQCPSLLAGGPHVVAAQEVTGGWVVLTVPGHYDAGDAGPVRLTFYPRP